VVAVVVGASTRCLKVGCVFVTIKHSADTPVRRSAEVPQASCDSGLTGFASAGHEPSDSWTSSTTGTVYGRLTTVSQRVSSGGGGGGGGTSGGAGIITSGATGAD
jgi:hypothetical protein